MYELDTIAAIATPPGPGGIGIVRVSGPQAGAVADAVFHRGGGPWRSHQLYAGRLCAADGTTLDAGMAVLMLAPRSYTGEDVLELHCHGSPVVLEQVLRTVLALGARPALAGEFTKRAFLNGRLDLTQAEAVMGLVSARTADAAQTAAAQLCGGLSAHVADIRERLVRAKAHVEAELDFGDEDVGLDPDALAGDIQTAQAAVDALLATAARGELLRRGLRVALSGRPNAGKSSLLNALVGAERAIVTAHPGTTRDVIEAAIDIAGVPVTLIDTAGLRDTGDAVEQLGVARAEHAAAAADLVLVVLDTARPFAEQAALLGRADAIAVLNKCDLPSAWSAADEAAAAGAHPCVRVSATASLGLDVLCQAIVARAGVQWADNLPPLTSARQREALARVARSLAAARASLAAGLPPELVAVDLQAALEHIGAVTGAVTSDDVLDAVFREFCIGK
ncbi:MAG TPA: tRNA uridine-5-carboxymethylaminomethyl(34) synthesis GTPase MnmE [Candidatus Dormibacteraeota bacterium]|nr:tRNA uridine-5-carboxymethylaminomethyl(34) synthesis GTPase MnmE [Candidatus Dormibacteraeota bacterium]